MPYSSMAPLSKKDKHLLGCSPPSIPIPRYLSAIYNSHYSCVILCIIFLSSLGSAVQLSLVWDGLVYFRGVSCVTLPM